MDEVVAFVVGLCALLMLRQLYAFHYPHTPKRGLSTEPSPASGNLMLRFAIASAMLIHAQSLLMIRTIFSAELFHALGQSIGAPIFLMLRTIACF